MKMADRRRDRFPELLESELTTLLDQKNSDNTKKATKVFSDYLIERKIDEDSLVASKDKLATILRNFYAAARKKKAAYRFPQKIENKLDDESKTVIELGYRKISASANN